MKTSRTKHRRPSSRTGRRLSNDLLLRQCQILRLEGTKKQIRVYEEARFAAYPKAAQRLFLSGKTTGFISKKAWDKAHRVGYKAAIKAGYKYDFLAKY